jgi:CDP-glucose 4,6-dehydratase
MPHPFAAFYRGKRVLVTGHTSFGCGWLVGWLKVLGAHVCGYGPPPFTRPNFFDATLLDRGMTSIFGDVRDRNALANAFADFQPEIVIHGTALPLLQRACPEPVETFATNVMGTVHVLEEARLTGCVRAVVVLSSSSCYENRNWFWTYREEDSLGGSDPCAASLAGVDIAALAYLRFFFQNSKTGVATARAARAIGGGDWSENQLIPDIVRTFSSGQPTLVSDSSTLVPCWHVLDAARAYLLLAQRLYESGQAFAGPWNFGPSEEGYVSAQKLATSFIKQWGCEKFSATTNDDDMQDSQPIRVNTRKARTQLGWTPALPPEETIAWTAAWYKSFLAEPASAWRTTEDQIDNYTRLTANQHIPASATSS